MPYNDFPENLLPRLKPGKLDKIQLDTLGAFLVSLAQSGVIHDSPELREYVHSQASIPVPSKEDIKKEMDRQARMDEQASQQKINPLESQQGARTDPENLEQDPQKANQDEVPVKRKKN
jgi:hypothetical protein